MKFIVGMEFCLETKHIESDSNLNRVRLDSQKSKCIDFNFKKKVSKGDLQYDGYDKAANVDHGWNLSKEYRINTPKISKLCFVGKKERKLSLYTWCSCKYIPMLQKIGPFVDH